MTILCHSIPAVEKINGKTSRGDLVIKDANLGGHRYLVVDTIITHEYGGNNLADVSRNGQLRDPNASRLLEDAARTKVVPYRDGYANRSGHTYTFLP